MQRNRVKVAAAILGLVAVPLLSGAARAQSTSTLPFRAQFSGSVPSAPFARPGTPSVVVTGQGQATVGNQSERETVRIRLTLYNANLRTTGCSTFQGTSVTTSPDRAQVGSVLIGTNCLQAGRLGNSVVNAVYLLTFGTGRYSGISGQGTIHATARTALGPGGQPVGMTSYTAVIRGTVTLPSK